jgi:hypothetical protein
MPTMKNTVFLLALVLVVLSSQGFAADQHKRRAVVVDRSGVVSEVSELRLTEGYDYTYNNIWWGQYNSSTESYAKMAIETPPFYIAVLVRSLVSIDVKGKIWNVTYRWDGCDKTISGNFAGGGSFTGKTDFGAFKLDSKNLKQLKFKGPPTSVAKGCRRPYDATLILRGGAKVPVADLRRFDNYCDSSGYIIGCRHVSRYYADVRFLRGDSVLTVPFDNISTIEFMNIPEDSWNFTEGSVIVTLKNGKKATGKVPDKNDARIKGFIGMCDRGEFFIEPYHVQRILFGRQQQ